MADNSSLPVAVGNETFANKDIAGVKFPKNIQYDSAGAEVVPATQTTAAAILAAVDTLETLIASTNTKLDTAITALQIIDNMVLSAGTNNIGDVDVLTLPALPAGTNAIGKLAANAGVNIGEVSIATASQNANGQATMANSGPVVIASDQSPVPVTPAGNVAHDAADSGNPIKVGGKATAALSGETLVTAGDRSNAYTDLDGSLLARNVSLADLIDGTASNTDGTSTSVIATAGAGIKQYLTQVSLSNSHASTSVMVALKSGTTSRWRVNVPPGGRELKFDPPLKPNAANEAWNFDPDAAVTTIECSMNGFKSKV